METRGFCLCPKSPGIAILGLFLMREILDYLAGGVAGELAAGTKIRTVSTGGTLSGSASQRLPMLNLFDFGSTQEISRK